ncbi:metal-dependent hydrolase [Imhoffiella purpurea]|uniref:Membrane-bound metal-dependent hydrolase n=1 Tax=Imhoffiella purpurea TaxID=1249627 RepID=W9VC07_9GAMM|nr:metal-dependent hydrolase [Imhoffiella purpurea]EXJ13572.1 hypothetical protein D779_3575 [Imhoffiella purpurea]
MLTPTHLLFAQTTYLTACVVAAHPPTPEEAAVALLGAALPDLDSRASYVGHILRLTSDFLERYFGHRSMTHSLLVQILAGLLAFWLLPFGFALALLSGWVSHSWADMMTKGGVAWFWPARIRCVLPGNPDYRMELAKGGEMGFLVIMILVGVVMMPLAQTGKGTAGLLRGALGDLEMVRRDYDQHKGDFLFSVQVRGKDNRTDRDISGTYAVMGPWREAGLILETPEGPRSLCAGSACNWYSAHAELTRGEPIKTSTVNVTTSLISVAELRERTEALSQTGAVFLLGTAQAEGIKPEPPTLEVTADALTFAYATPAILDKLQGRSLRNVDLTLQVRHAPDASLPEQNPIKPVGAATPELLERWLR